MAIYFQHVGERGGTRDFPKTIGLPSGNLKQFSVGDFPELQDALGTAELSRAEQVTARIAPNGFQVWGIPAGATSVVRHLREGDWLLLLMSDRPGGQFYYGGQVVYRPTRELFGLSRTLWGEERFPLIVFLSGRLTSYPWEMFRESFGYAENWRLAGNTYRLTDERIIRSPYETELRVIEAILGTSELTGQEFSTFEQLLDQVELMIDAHEGRRLLREHLARERDPSLIRQFKGLLSEFRCSVCKFDFENAYGAIGIGFIEAHHQAPLGLREGDEVTSILDLVPVCSNCHRMLHRRVPPFTVDEMSELMARALERRTT